MNGKNKPLGFRSCAGIMVLNPAGKVWVGHRLVPDGGELSLSDKRWQMPQGGIDKNEDPRMAAERELWEETGMKTVSLLKAADEIIRYELPEELIGTALKGKYRGQELHWFAYRFEGDENEINIENPPDGAPVEFDAWRWVDMEVVPDLIVDFKKAMYAEVVAAFRHLVQ